MLRLTLYRAVIGVAIFLMVWGQFYEVATLPQKQLMPWILLLFVALLLFNILLARSQLSRSNQRLLSYAMDIVVAGFVVYATGGVDSPFAFLFGLVIIASGTHASRMLPLVLSLLACAIYLVSVYGEAWGVSQRVLDSVVGVHILLQVSALMLVGGVMAFIARRHASLRDSSVKAVRQHRKLKDLHEQLMASMGEGVVVLSADLHVSDMNRAASALLADSDVVAMVQTPALAQLFHQQGGQCEYRSGKRQLLVVVTALLPDSDATWLLTLVDISHLRRLEQKLMQKERLAVMGQMSAMLAHEIRNPVQVMSQGLELLAKGYGQREAIQSMLHDEMSRLRRLVLRMLDYSQPLAPLPKDVAMRPLICRSIDKALALRDGRVESHVTVESLCLDQDHFLLVLDNLLDNALVNSVEGQPVSLLLQSEGEGWLLNIRNRGVIQDGIYGQLFEPFVTGRSNGVGLGLATVQQVCEANGWKVKVTQHTGEVCFIVESSG